MRHDWYAAFVVATREDVDALVRAQGRYAEITDVGARAALLSTALGVEGKWADARGRPVDPKAYAQVGERGRAAGLRAIIHQGQAPDGASGRSLQLLRDLGIQAELQISTLPAGTFQLRVPIALATPWLSRDDFGLYVIENPVRKDPVFGVPTISPAGWKGMLRWAATKVCLEPLADRASDFVRERVALTRLFGSEKGGGEEEVRGFAKYLDGLCPAAAAPYRAALGSASAAGGNTEEEEALASLRGRLHFLPTFFDRLGMEVLNPHDRSRGVGTVPIYMECVPAGATGAFEVIYVPWPGGAGDVQGPIQEAISNMQRVVHALQALCLDFGISAKRSSGYGLVRDGWSAAAGLLRLMTSSGPNEKTFRNFAELAEAVETMAREVTRG